MSDWTPAPWDIRKIDPFEYSINSGSSRGNPHRWDRMAVAYGPEDDGRKGADIAYANAHLIAAAPDLYEALENLLIAIGMGWDLDGTIDRSQAALARARGEAQ